MDVAANLHLATARALTEFRQYINSDLESNDLKYRPLSSEIETIEVFKPSKIVKKLLLATTWLLYQAETHLF